MTAPIRWKSKVILFKSEVSEGTDPTPTGADNAMLMTNVEFSPMEGEDVSRDLEFPYLAAQGMIPTGLRCRLKGRVELVGSGTAGVAPAWGPMLRACGVAETIVEDTSVAYNPITDAMESGTAYFWMGPTKHVVKGMRGTAKFGLTAQQIPYAEFDQVGLYADPTDASPASPTLTAFQKPVIVSKANTPTFTVNSVPLVLRDFSLTFNNQVEPRLLVGVERILIVDRAEAISAVVEATPVATFNPYTLAKNETSVAVSLVHGTAAGKIATLAAPTCQVKRPTGYQNNQNIAEWPLDLIPLPASGNDQWSLTLT
jgi:hypothetical protein